MPTTLPRQNLYNYGEIAELLGISRERLYYHVDHGYIPKPTYKKGKRLYYLANEVEAIKKYWLGIVV
jgi:DNA-binding transcriptional MerR regulator